MSHKRTVLLKTLAKAKPGVQNDPSLSDLARSILSSLRQFSTHDGHRISYGRHRAPFPRTPPHVHENKATSQAGQSLEHRGVPGSTADVVDNLRPCLDGGLGDAGLVSVDG